MRSSAHPPNSIKFDGRAGRRATSPLASDHGAWPWLASLMMASASIKAQRRHVGEVHHVLAATTPDGGVMSSGIRSWSRRDVSCSGRLLRVVDLQVPPIAYEVVALSVRAVPLVDGCRSEHGTISELSTCREMAPEERLWQPLA